MQFKDIVVPEVYESESADFRFFLNWFATCLTRVKFDIENMLDLYDPLRCPSEQVWMLADSMGFRYDDRLPMAYNRLVLMYFMSMIRNKGSKDGVTLAAEVNLAQFNILEYGKEKDILYERLEDTSIPVNSAYVTPHVEEGYIDVVYYSEEKPIDACIEYVRPVGMYLFQHAGVSYDARTKISVDARLTDMENVGMSIGATHVGHYSREDYARMQRMENESEFKINEDHTRRDVWFRNSEAEGEPNPKINPGYRSLFSLQLCNNDHVVKSLLPEIHKIFSLGYGPEDVMVDYPDSYVKQMYDPLHPFINRDKVRNPNIPEYMAYNLGFDRDRERDDTGGDVYTIYDTDSYDGDGKPHLLNPVPAVNPPKFNVGDALAVDSGNSAYWMSDFTQHEAEELHNPETEITPDPGNVIPVPELPKDDNQ